MIIRNEIECLKRQLGLGLSVLVILLVSFESASADLLIQVPDPGPTHTPGSGLSSWSIISQPFTLDTAAKNVQIQLGLQSFYPYPPLDIYLSDRVGPGTALENVVTTSSLNPGGRSFYNVMNVPVLPAGEWFVTADSPTGSNISWLFSNVPVTVTGQVGNHRFINYRAQHNANKAFPPASGFETATGATNRKHLIKVFGDPIDLNITEPTAPGTVVQIDAGNPTGNGVTTDGKRTFHKLSAQSVAGSAPASDTGSIERFFTFERDDGLTDPILATVFGDLHGRLITDNQGLASVIASLVLKDSVGNGIGADNRNIVSNPAIGFQEEVEVNERLEIVAPLVPGQLYSITSSLTVNASSPLNGAGRAFFDETFTVDITNEPVPAPATLPIMLGMLALVGRSGRSPR